MNCDITLFEVVSTSSKIICRYDIGKYILFDGNALEFYSINEELYLLLYLISKRYNRKEIIEEFSVIYSENTVEGIEEMIDLYIDNIPLATIDLSCY